jgi:uncharacterized protein (TIGR02646 family)
MRRVYRKDCPCPSEWDRQVRKNLRDHAEFLKQAAEFERLGLNSDARRKGFTSHAPKVLVKKRDGHDFPNAWRRHKEAIAKMSHRKCVYCEGKINGPAAGNVDHFKPKALFPLLAYEWTNYFLACESCNTAKHDKWPRSGGYIRPDQGDPSRHFFFAEDGTAKAVRPGSAADRMIEDLDLKREWLSDERKQNIEKMLSLVNDAIKSFQAGDEARAKRLARIVLGTVEGPEVAYSVALIQCFWRDWESACPGATV